jgi:integrase
MAVRKFRDRWGVDIRLEGGRRIRFRSPENSRAGALAYEAHLRNELAVKSPDLVLQRPRLLRDAIEDWYRDDVLVNRKPSVKLHYRDIVNRFVTKDLGNHKINEITTLDIERYKGKLIERGCGTAVINHVLIVLSKFYRCAIDWGWVSQRPKVKFLRMPPTKFRFLSHDESRTLRAAASEFQGGRWHDMAVCALRTGMRISELAALRWEDIDLDHRIVNVTRGLSGGIETTPKNGKGRAIPMTVDLFETLSKRPRIGPRVFATTYQPSGFCVTASRAFRGLRRRVGFTDVSWHTLRHTFASLLLMAGVPINSVQYLMGHSSIQMTMRYAHLAPGALDDAMRSLAAAEARALSQKSGHQIGTAASAALTSHEPSA